jgi:2-haloacid dehalogenase
MDYRAITFDTGGTVLDWHSSMLDEVKQVHAWQALAFDRHEFVNTWRRNTMKGIVGQVSPAFHMDDVHWNALEETIAAFGLPPPSAAVLDKLWRGWHRLRAWPDFPAALEKLRQRLPVVSFTMLPTSLVVDVSRANGISWDAIISCQMIGVYENILMVACHNFDLNAAQDAGFKTAFVRRPDEWGPVGPPDPQPNRTYDYVCDDFDELTAEVMVLRREGV